MSTTEPAEPDLSALLADVGPDVTRAVVEAFLTAVPGRVLALRAAADDPHAAREAAHSLKSAAALVGRSRLAERALEVEQGSDATDLLIAELEASSRMLHDWLRRQGR